jgi:hypothetical protein
MTREAKAAFEAFKKTWRDARRFDHATFVLAWNNAARAALIKP